MSNFDKAWIASELRSQIAYYTELTVNEHKTGKLDKEADKAWKKVEKLINTLGGLDDQS
jgi:hypothetical protein